MTKKTPKKKAFKYVLLIVTICMILFAFNKNNDYNSLKEVLVKDKQDLQTELAQIVDDYKHLNVKNKKLSKRVINEINKILSLQKSVNELKVENFDLIRTYRKETAKLHEQNRVLIGKVDSLNKVNTNLKAEKLLAVKSLKKEEGITKKLATKNTALIKANKKLEALMAPAKMIKVSDIKSVALKERNGGKLKSTSKHNKTDAIKVNFKLLKNQLTTPGEKKIHIQVLDNKNIPISVKDEIVLNNKKRVPYSDEVRVDYKNQDIDVLSLILVDRKDMKKGPYKINVFIDGDFSSKSSVVLR